MAIVASAPIALISTARQVDHPISDPISAIVMWVAIWWFGVMRPAVRLTADELVVRNPLWTHRIPRANVASVRRGLFGAVISRRVGRRCIAFALLRSRRFGSVDLINYWAQTPPGEVPEGMYPEEPRRTPAGEIWTAAGLAVAFTLFAVMLAWPRHPSWFFPAIAVAAAIALVPVALTQRDR